MTKSYSVLFRRFAVLAALCLGGAAAAAGCAAPPGSPSEERTDEASEAIGGACCFGDYVCPTDQADFEYLPGGCGGVTQLTAYNHCNAHCGPACVNYPPADSC